MHLLTFIQLREPGPAFRAAVILTQGIVYNGFFACYLLSPKTCHRFVGYLEARTAPAPPSASLPCFLRRSRAPVVHGLTLSTRHAQEEAVRTYTHAIHDLDAGKIPDWSDRQAPEIAINYWKLRPGNDKIRDLLLAIRADEACHSHVNHTLATIEWDAPNPFRRACGALRACGRRPATSVGWSRIISVDDSCTPWAQERAHRAASQLRRPSAWHRCRGRVSSGGGAVASALLWLFPRCALQRPLTSVLVTFSVCVCWTAGHPKRVPRKVILCTAARCGPPCQDVLCPAAYYAQTIRRR